MKNLLRIFLLLPFLLAFQCEDDDPCSLKFTSKVKPNLISVENLQSTYNVGDTLWLSSEIERIQQFDNETIDILNFPEKIGFGIQFKKETSYSNEPIFICLDNNTVTFTQGYLFLNYDCNRFIYDVNNSNLNCRVGIKLLEAGNFTIELNSIMNFRTNGNNCNDEVLEIKTNFIENQSLSIYFTVN